MTGTFSATSARLRGCGTALVTPFNATGAVDEPALRSLIDWQLEQGVHMLIPCGSTGEAVTLSAAEHRRVVEITVEQVNGRVPVVAGAGSNDTAKAVATSREMQAIGATHLLHVTPMYNKPPQRALLAHFRAVADGCDLPIVIYNVPGRTAVNLEAATCLELAADPRFVAVKEASGNLAQIATIIRERPAHFSVLSGDDGITLALMAHGADGVISVVSNILPGAMAQLCEAMTRGDLAKARELDARLAPVIDACFVESNPIPAKAMLAMMGRMDNRLRLPLLPLQDNLLPRVRSVLEHAGVTLTAH
ncbi:4-hydroxy-tetrahydrodipicolinate synthase [Gemmatimonas sp. UBA7669]|uniref:4-hydroxy-tetrahydrodipicolinate synthase n=1 Tax=Gemmatimonas sp. UBA7669 TaxID=1946568 RepID=UPI0025BD45EF|nr:4-hydroxy-tetrahydrodipicolinate synthase [Gemmatimonas sp. UBA7669]